MKTNIASLCLTLLAFWGLNAHAQSGKRMALPEVRAMMEKSRGAMAKERSQAARKEILKALYDRLSEEFQKGASSFDETFIEVNSYRSNIQYLLSADCQRSYELVANQTYGPEGPSLKQRKIREYSIQIHGTLCRKD